MRRLFFFLCVLPLQRIVYQRYEILSDPEKRSIYDARGEAGLSESGGMGGMDPQVSCGFATVIMSAI